MGSPRESDPPALDRSGGSIIQQTHSKLTMLRARLEDQEGEIHQKVQRFYNIKHAISRICKNDEEYLDNPDIIKANTVLEERIPVTPERTCHTAADALALLKAGNQQFLRDEVAPKQSSTRKIELHFGQKPHAVIIACSDSRVPPEMIFNQGFGDLFVIRLAGNTVDALARASLLYAVLHLQAPLVVVLGHESCGAVTAALAPEDKSKDAPGDIKALISNIQKGVSCDTVHCDSEDERLLCAIVSNVFHVVHSLEEHPDISPLVQQGKLAVVGAFYGFHGVVSFFDGEDGAPIPRTPGGSFQQEPAPATLCMSCSSSTHSLKEAAAAAGTTNGHAHAHGNDSP